MNSPAPAGAGAINGVTDAIDLAVPVPDYDEDPDEMFSGPGIGDFLHDEEDQDYEDFNEPLELSIAQSGYPEEEPQMDILRDYTQSY